MASFQHLHQPTKARLSIDEQVYLFFGGTAYLGLLDNPEYIDLYKQGIDKYGLNNGTSRTNNIQLGIYEEAEEKLASRFGFESSALFSSGYLAAQATVRALIEDREVIYAPACHPALWVDNKPTVDLNFEEWILETVSYINGSTTNKFVIISNCIDNLRPANYDFSLFSSVADNKELLFILDDSHGLGVINYNSVSSDLTSLKAKINFKIVLVSSLAKGLGTDAGLVLGDVECLNKVKNHPIFMGASPASPASIYALIHGNMIYEEAFYKLRYNIEYFEHLISGDSGLSHIPNFPVFSSLEASLYSYLSQNNILISSFPYPLPTSELLNRIVISALHTDADLNRLANIYLRKAK